MSVPATPALPSPPKPANVAVWRRRLCAAAGIAGLLASTMAQAATGQLFADASLKARAMATRPYQAFEPVSPTGVQTLQALGDVRFRPSRAIRLGASDYELRLSYPSAAQSQAMNLNVVANGETRRIPLRNGDFLLPRQAATLGDEPLGIAGWQLWYPITRAGNKEPYVAFTGGTSLQMAGAGQDMGTAAAGLVVDPNELTYDDAPRFTDYWLQPALRAGEPTVVVALLDSPLVTGAYQFEIAPARTGQANPSMLVTAQLFMRPTYIPVRTLGLAPLVSMFDLAENQMANGTAQAEVHNADGLLLHINEGEWLWRPLQSTQTPLITAFMSKDLRGFGLMQRDHAAAHYEQVGEAYARRPSVWITPVGNWGEGRVELTQLPSSGRANGNVRAYWVPATVPAPGQSMKLSWRVEWQGEQVAAPPDGWVTRTAAVTDGMTVQPGQYQFDVDFTGPSLDKLPAGARVVAVVSSDVNGRVAEAPVWRDEATGQWRMSLRVRQLDATHPVELRAYLAVGKDALTETWSYILPATQPAAAVAAR